MKCDYIYSILSEHNNAVTWQLRVMQWKVMAYVTDATWYATYRNIPLWRKWLQQVTLQSELYYITLLQWHSKMNISHYCTKVTMSRWEGTGVLWLDMSFNLSTRHDFVMKIKKGTSKYIFQMYKSEY